MVRFTEFDESEEQQVKNIMNSINNASFEKNIFCFSKNNIKIHYFYTSERPFFNNKNIKYSFTFHDDIFKSSMHILKDLDVKQFAGSVRTPSLNFSMSLSASSFYNDIFEDKKINHNVKVQIDFFNRLSYSNHAFAGIFEKAPHLLAFINEKNYKEYSALSKNLNLDNYKKVLQYAYELNKDVFELNSEEKEFFSLNNDVNINLDITEYIENESTGFIALIKQKFMRKKT